MPNIIRIVARLTAQRPSPKDPSIQWNRATRFPNGTTLRKPQISRSTAIAGGKEAFHPSVLSREKQSTARSTQYGGKVRSPIVAGRTWPLRVTIFASCSFMLSLRRMRTALALVAGILLVTRGADANDANRSHTWVVAGMGIEATEWRVTTHGTERGLMAALHTAGVTSGNWSSANGMQIFSIGGGEGGIQVEYLNRFAYGLRFWRIGQGALVLRGGLAFDIIGTPHGGNFELGPLFDVGYQIVAQSGFFDVSLQTVIPIIPAILSENSSHYAAEWFSSGPHLSAGFGHVYLDGYVARTMYDGEMRTEAHIDTCGGSGIILCSRLQNFRYDDARKPVTLLGLFVGFGGVGPGRTN
jgi:hypothetical protein